MLQAPTYIIYTYTLNKIFVFFPLHEFCYIIHFVIISMTTYSSKGIFIYFIVCCHCYFFHKFLHVHTFDHAVAVLPIPQPHMSLAKETIFSVELRRDCAQIEI